ncbi:portal protein [Alteromonas sp. C1M14]|uniref:portal protein n=1 Tax=Alteromonas sp. C1M14 TaxID=2841567 RepID=UPI001C094E2C|nr:portal protein [Alteromonas sp. C1M14]MBU2979016.1 hypothetical protein [Alteromonas sp. C1M14]
MGLLSKITGRFGRHSSGDMVVTPTEEQESINDTRRGTTVDSNNYLRRMYDEMYVSPEYKASVLSIRTMDKQDGRVKKIHRRMARDATKGGIRIHWKGAENKRISKLFTQWKKRMGLDNAQKLQSDARGAVMEGQLALQWVVNDRREMTLGLRMPGETMYPDTDATGQFKSTQSAYKQLDPVGGYQIIAEFAFWQISMVRLDPDNFDDYGAPGRPYLDASRKSWKQLTMTEDDLVIRRRTRAPQRFSHVLEGAEDKKLQAYKNEQEAVKGEITTDFYSNCKGGVTALGGDAQLDAIADVVHLLDTFFAGAPAPKGLFGYSDGLNRDILEDLKKDYFEEIDGLQDTLSQAYYEGFRLQLLLNGINPDAYDFQVQFSERKTETRNQKADLALKYQAMGVPDSHVWETAGLEPENVMDRIKAQKNSKDPYPSEQDDDDGTVTNDGTKQRVTITPGNQSKGESATHVSNT